MTPYNLVHMAALLGYDIIALTDHNSTGNCRSALQCGQEAGITVIPGMELCTAEEIHVVCLFPDLEQAEAFGKEITRRLPPIRNKPEVFGEQLYMDAADQVLGNEEILLVTACAVGLDEVGDLVTQYKGFCYPAHIDRSSFSVLASFGVFPPDLGFSSAEVSRNGDPEQLCREHPPLRDMRILRSSDAHYLEDMPDPKCTLPIPENTAQSAVDYLRGIL